MFSPPYCLPIDVLRRFDPTKSQADLENDMFFAADDMEKFRAEIEDASSEFDTKTNNAQRITQIGRGDRRFEYHDSTADKYQGGVRIWLDHQNVLPFDPDEGDKLQVRRGKRDYRDITGNKQLYRLNCTDGTLQIFVRGRHSNIRYGRALQDDFVRVQYRYGGYGGDRKHAGQTVLESALEAEGNQTVMVEHPERLPNSGVLLVGGFGGEYVRFAGVDDDTGELSMVERGVRGSVQTDIAAGMPVHHCSSEIRKGVAGYVACEFVRSDDYADNMPTPDDSISHSDKIESWETAWDKLLGKYSEARML